LRQGFEQLGLAGLAERFVRLEWVFGFVGLQRLVWLVRLHRQHRRHAEHGWRLFRWQLAAERRRLIVVGRGHAERRFVLAEWGHAIGWFFRWVFGPAEWWLVLTVRLVIGRRRLYRFSFAGLELRRRPHGWHGHGRQRHLSQPVGL
jgi:hypothetical protein